MIVLSLTRKYLKAMGIEDEKIDQIIEAHSETVTGLKDEAAKYKADAEKLPSVQAALTRAEETAKASEKDPFKVKYEALKEEFEGFKTETTKKETTASKTKAYKELLKELNISDKIIDKVVKLADIDAIEIVDGKIKDAETLSTSLKNEWADFITQPKTTGAKVETPPTGDHVSPETEVIAKVREAMGLPKTETKGS
jgi:DNA repair exonuclease SbcCD ATPase subunit